MCGVSRKSRTDSIHLALANIVNTVSDRFGVPADIRQTEEWASVSRFKPDDPGDGLVTYVLGVAFAWIVLGIVATLLMVAAAYVTDQIAGQSAVNVVLAIGLGLAFFCVAGAFDASFRSLLARVARRRYNRYGLGDARHKRLANWARPRNSGLILQALVGLFAGLLAIIKS
jgi:hypothetical protein